MSNAKRAEEIAEIIHKLPCHWISCDGDKCPTYNEIAKALESYADEERLAQRDVEQFGEAFVLNGKRISPDERTCGASSSQFIHVRKGAIGYTDRPCGANPFPSTN